MLRKVFRFWKKYIWHFLYLVAFCNSISSQTYVVTRYADDNGLPSRIVRDVIQDSKGFIWVAGNNGLYKFDGQNFKPFLSSLKDTTGLRDNKIIAICETSDGRLWVGTPKGLHVLENNQITHFRLKETPSENEEYILNIFEDGLENVWVSTYGGVFSFSKSAGPLHFLGDDDAITLSKETVWSVTQDSKGVVWASTNDGLFIKTKNQPYSFNRVKLLFDESINDTDISYYKVQQFNDSLYIIDTSHGLLKGKFKQDAFVLSYFKNSEGQSEKGYAVERSIIDKNGDIWLATWKHYLKKFKVDGERLVEQAVNSKNGFLGITGISHSVFEDVQGNIWVANTNGLYKFSSDQNQITSFPPHGCLDNFLGIYSIIEDQAHNLWVTTPTKLYRFKKEDLLQNNCPTEYLTFAEKGMQQVRNLFIDQGNRLWIGADGGLFVTQLDSHFNPGEFVRYGKKDGLPHNWSYEVYQESKNKYWLGNHNGLIKLELKNDGLDIIELKVYKADQTDQNRLVNSQVMQLESDGKNLWIGTFSGISKLISEKEEGLFTNYTARHGSTQALSNNSIKRLFKDSQDRFWIATQRGLNLYRPEQDTFLQFGHAEGLPSEYILGMDEDSKGFLWICTTNGIVKAKYDSISRAFIEKEHFTSKDGLIDNIPYRNAIHIDEEDNVFIGSRDGISIFRNNYFGVKDTVVSPLRITDIQATQKNEVGFKSVAGKVNDSSLVLPHNSNSLKINYVILDFLNPSGNRYRHKFLPENNAWVETGKQSELNYYNLPPGEYELVLDGTNGKGQWSKTPARLYIKVKPPFWKTNWAIFGYTLAILGVIGLVYKGRIRKKEKEWAQKMALEKAIIDEREQMRKENAADFHDELGSMVTKISMFLTMAERNLEEQKDPRPFFQKIRLNTKGLSTGFRDLLWVIDPQKDSLADTFMRLKEFGEDFFDQSKIDFATSEFQEIFTKRILNPKIKKQVVMIFKEAMNNCLKYSDGDKAYLVLETNGKFSKMEFSDNGSGFDIEKKSKGRGLKNMRVRADTIDTILSINSSSRGTSIILDRIPHMGDVFSDSQT